MSSHWRPQNGQSGESCADHITEKRRPTQNDESEGGPEHASAHHETHVAGYSHNSDHTTKPNNGGMKPKVNCWEAEVPGCSEPAPKIRGAPNDGNNSRSFDAEERGR